MGYGNDTGGQTITDMNMATGWNRRGPHGPTREGRQAGWIHYARKWSDTP